MVLLLVFVFLVGPSVFPLVSRFCLLIGRLVLLAGRSVLLADRSVGQSFFYWRGRFENMPYV